MEARRSGLDTTQSSRGSGHSDEYGSAIPNCEDQSMTPLAERANLEGKIAAVVGGAQRLGRTISLDLACSGVHLAICDNDQAALEATENTIKEIGVRIVTHAADVMDEGAISGFYRACDQVFDHLDILVHVVGGVFQRDFMDTPVDEYQMAIGRNFGYILHSTREAVQRIRVGGNGGSIINITTIEAHRAAPGFSVYAGAKAATTNFSRSLAIELAPEKIRVNTIAPECVGAEVSAMPPAQWRHPERAEEMYTKGFAMYVPMGAVGVFEDISNCVLFLASDLSQFMTGTTVHVDGGILAASGWIHWLESDEFLPMPPPSAMERLFGED